MIPPGSSKLVSFRANALKKGVPFKIVSLQCPTAGLAVEATPTFGNGNVCAISFNNTPYSIRLNRNTPIGYAVRSNPVCGPNGKTAEQPETCCQVPPGNGDRDTIGPAKVSDHQSNGDEPLPVADGLGSVTSASCEAKLPVKVSLPRIPPQAVCHACAGQSCCFQSALLEGTPVSSLADLESAANFVTPSVESLVEPCDTPSRDVPGPDPCAVTVRVAAAKAASLVRTRVVQSDPWRV